MTIDLLKAPDGTNFIVRLRSDVLGRDFTIPLSPECSAAAQRFINEEGDKRLFLPSRLNGS